MNTRNTPVSPADFCIITASNDEESLQRNLMASPMVGAGVPVHVERGAPSAAIAYNRGLDATIAPWVIFAHQDVYFPPGWEERLCRAIDLVAGKDPDWALIGPFGMSAEGEHLGDVWSTSLTRRVGRPVSQPQPVESFDELAFVMRRQSGLRFDEELPLWHLYGTDIVQMARAAGKGAWVADLPLVHNDCFHDRLRADFGAAYHYMRRKWHDRLPLRSPVLWITRRGLGLPLYRLRAWRSQNRRRAMAGDPKADPRFYSASLGWEVVTPGTPGSER